VIFAIIDSNSDNNLKFNEFRQKLMLMEMRLDEEEMISLFKSIDVNNSGSIEYAELIQKFSQLNN
jgi:Ca2+-binding EF-hand superfamily protein